MRKLTILLIILIQHLSPGLVNYSYSFQAPVAGRYLFATSVRIDDVANNSTQWAQGAFNNVTTGRSYRIGLFDYDGVSKRFVTVAGSVIMNLAASDVVSLPLVLVRVPHRTFLDKAPQMVRTEAFSADTF